MVRQYLTECTEAHGPAPRFTHCILPLATDAHFSNLAAPPPTTGAPLVTEAPEIVAPVIANITETRDIQPIGPTSIIVSVFISFHAAACAATEMVVHGIVTQFAAAATQSPFPDIRC